jgi:hypothetical protein
VNRKRKVETTLVALGAAVAVYYAVYWILTLPGLLVLALFLALLVILGTMAWSAPVRNDWGEIDRELDEREAARNLRPSGHVEASPQRPPLRAVPGPDDGGWYHPDGDPSLAMGFPPERLRGPQAGH